jgi:hypothetical protein
MGYVTGTGFWCLLVVVAGLVVLLVRQRQVTTRLRHRIAPAEANVRAQDAELTHLAAARLPALADSLQGRAVEIPGPLHGELVDTAFGPAQDAVIELFRTSVRHAIERGEQSARATLKATMKGVQSLAAEQQLAISTMQERHDNPAVLEDLMKIDHMNSQLGRRAQVTAVLCGSWPGQQRSASALTDIVGGATSRIRDYLRVRVPAQADMHVISRAVEPVVLAIAELLDNGARYSQPNTLVEVNFQQAHNGVAVIIDDAGVGMNAEETRRATNLLSGNAVLDINRLGDPPQVGFAVTGLLAARYGFSVSVDTRSPYGGVRAVVFLPTALLTQATKPAAVHELPATPKQPAPVPETAERTTASGLPIRRRREQVAEPATAGSQALPPEPATITTLEPVRPPNEVASGLGAWQRGTRSGRSAAPAEPEGRPKA